MDSLMTFKLLGKFKPYVRMTQRSKFVDPESRRYLNSKSWLRQQFRSQMAEHGWECLPRATPLGLCVIIRSPGGLNNRDFDNELKAIADAANSVVYPDDRWINLGLIIKLPYAANVQELETVVLAWKLGDAASLPDLNCIASRATQVGRDD